MKLRGRIFTGDLVRALSQVGDASGANWPTIVALLGFGFEVPLGEVVRPDPAKSGMIRPQPAPLPASFPEPPPPPAAGEADIGELLDFELQHSTAAPEALPMNPPVEEKPDAASRFPLSPLFHSLWERGVILEAAGTPRPEGEIAIVEAIHLIARGEGWRDLPVEKIQSVSKGCQILADTGLGMQPFAGDTRQLVRSIRRTVGEEHVCVLTFLDCPTRGVLSESYRDDSYRPPDNGATVVAISDLCAGGPRSAIRDAEPEAWLAIARQVRDAGSLFMVLNPYPPGRWPSSLVDRIAIIHWHRTTRSADVRKTRRRVRS